MGLASAMLRRDSPHRACTVLAALPVCDRVLITLHRQMLGGVNVPQMLCGTNQGIGPSRAGKAVDTPGCGGGPVGAQGVQVVAAGEADHHQQVQHAQVPHQQPCACAHNPPHLRRSQGGNVSSGRATCGMPTEKFEGSAGSGRENCTCISERCLARPAAVWHRMPLRSISDRMPEHEKC